MKAKLLSVAVALLALWAVPSAFADSGGSGGFQAGAQSASTNQAALGAAASYQNAVNANVPVSIAGGNVTSGPSSATQTATSDATTDVSNKAKTDQDQHLNQNIGGNSGCYAGCGGAGGFQAGVQNAETNQLAAGVAHSDQNAVNANVPVSIAGGNVNSGPSSATQTASSSANTDVSNKAKTDQDQSLHQNIGGGSCSLGCGGAGGFQAGIQDAQTNQLAVGVAKSDQNAVNANVPVSIAGGNVSSGPSSATQTATSDATTDVSNKAKTDQDQSLHQNLGDRWCGCEGRDMKTQCVAGCGGAGGFQLGVQKADTNQIAAGAAFSNQNAVNSNTPVSTAGGNIYSGPSSATQTATSNATTDVSNRSKTDQDQWLHQDLGGKDCGCSKDGRDGKDSHDGLSAGSGGAGGFQAGIQAAETNQAAFGISKSDQNAVNGNAPVSTAGGNITSGPSSATQTATSDATTDVSNKAKTDQDQGLKQDIGGKGCGCRHDGKDGRGESKDSHDGLSAGSGGAGGFQLGAQLAETNQLAAGAAFSNQNAVNSNTPSSTAGGNIYAGPSSATQRATSNAYTDVSNRAKTDQDQWQRQQLPVSRI